jgi:uncharacterized protein (DUF58 family)
MTTDTGSARNDLLPPQRMAQLERLARRSNRKLLGALMGRHQSIRKGSSLDFADHRKYFAGDDVRHIDYHVLARFDQLMVRQFDAEEQNTLRLVLDTSASMSVGGKFRHASEIAAALGFVALSGGDTVCIHTIANPLPRTFAGVLGLVQLLESLETMELGGTTSLDATLSVVASRQGPPGTTVLLSDLFAEDWAASLRRLVHPRRTTLVVQTLHADEVTPAIRGDLELTDVESRQTRAVSVDEKSAREHADRAQNWLREITTTATSLRMDHHVSFVDGDVVELLVNALEQPARR